MGAWVRGAAVVPAFLRRSFRSTPAPGSASPSLGGEPPSPVALSKLKDSFLDGTSSSYLEGLEESYRRDPTSVDRTWASFFRMQVSCLRVVKAPQESGCAASSCSKMEISRPQGYHRDDRTS